MCLFVGYSERKVLKLLLETLPRAEVDSLSSNCLFLRESSLLESIVSVYLSCRLKSLISPLESSIIRPDLAWSLFLADIPCYLRTWPAVLKTFCGFSPGRRCKVPADFYFLRRLDRFTPRRRESWLCFLKGLSRMVFLSTISNRGGR